MIQRAVQKLVIETPGADVVSWLRNQFVDVHRAADGKERTISSLNSTVTRVRNAVISGNHRASKYDPFPLQLHASNNKEIAAFLAAPLGDQLAIQKAHAKTPTWSAAAEACLGQIQLLPKSMETFKVTKEQTLLMRKAQEQSVTRKNECIIVIPDAVALLKTLEQMLTSSQPHDYNPRLVLPLLLASGRRLTEVCSPRSVFDPVEGNPYYCSFKGALKKKGTKDSGVIPLLVPFDTFAKGLAALRAKQFDTTSEDGRRATKSVSELTNAQIKTRYGHATNLALDAGQILPLPEYEAPKTGEKRRPHNHDLRAMYATYVHELFHPAGGSFNRNAMRCLLHTTIQESLNYAHVQLEGVASLRGSLGPLALQ